MDCSNTFEHSDAVGDGEVPLLLTGGAHHVSSPRQPLSALHLRVEVVLLLPPWVETHRSVSAQLLLEVAREEEGTAHSPRHRARKVVHTH